MIIVNDAARAGGSDNSSNLLLSSQTDKYIVKRPKQEHGSSEEGAHTPPVFTS